MRQIGSIPHEEAAITFGDYLLASGIANLVEPAGEMWAIWVENDDHVERARAELEAFMHSPDSAKYRQTASEASAIRARNQRRQARLAHNYIDVRTAGTSRGGRVPPLTMVLVATCLLVAAVTRLDTPHFEEVDGVAVIKGPLGYLLTASSLAPGQHGPWAGLSEITRGQVWRAITPVFVHYGIIHLVFNLFWLVDLGGIIERQRGTWFLLCLVLVGGALSNVAGCLWDGPFGAGMSGVIYAIFGYVWMKSRYAPQEGMHVAPQNVIILIAWLFICMTGMVGPVGNAAHVTGLLFGTITGGGRHAWRRLQRRF